MRSLYDFCRDHRRAIGRFALWVSLVVLGVFLILGLYTTIKSVTTETAGYEIDSTNFTLYKNSRLEECLASTPERVNCTVVMADQIVGRIEDGQRFLNGATYSKGFPELQNGWCSLASCLRGFKVIPSSPFQSAFRSSGIVVWIHITVTLMTAIWATRAIFHGKIHDPEDCKGFGIIDWILSPVDLGIICFWWYSFIAVVIDPQDTSTISILTWYTPWLVALLLNFHPFACRFDMGSGSGRVFVWMMATLALLQWIATVYIWQLKGADIFNSSKKNSYRSYRCLESDIFQAPGISQCSPKQLCSKDWLFSNIEWYNISGLQGFQIHYGIVFGVLSMVAFTFPVLSLILNRGRRLLDFQALRRKATDADSFNMRSIYLFFVVVSLAVLIVILIWIGTSLFSDILKPVDFMNRESVIAYDVDCQALHVFLSPWRYYLDINGYGRALRIAKMWLNA
jgi:hypothetical protein